MVELPEWVLRHKKKGIAIDRKGNNYYAYRIHSEWDANKGRSKKISDEYLGKVTPDGILPPKHKRQKKVSSIIETGNVIYANRFAKTLIDPLKEFWPESWESILAAGVLKLVYREPLKRFSFRYNTCYAKQLWPNAHLSKNSLTKLLSMLGGEWSCQRSFFEDISRYETSMAIDLTHFFSDSDKIAWLESGYNPQGISHKQLQLLMLWGMDTQSPGFLKLLPGTGSASKNIILGIQESRFKNVTVVGDKAFYSADNIDWLEDAEIHHVLALRRDLSFLKYPATSKYKGHFIHRKNAQWWIEYNWGDRRIVQYLDKQIAADEESAFLRRVDEGNATNAAFQKARKRFGTLALITDTGLDPKRLYEFYKQRREIEQMFDTLKNELDGDKTWMQSRESMQGYYFILFIALRIYCQILDHLKRKDLLKKYSVHDVLWNLSKVYTVNVDGTELLGEVTKSTRKLIEEVEVPITQYVGS